MPALKYHGPCPAHPQRIRRGCPHCWALAMRTRYHKGDAAKAEARAGFIPEPERLPYAKQGTPIYRGLHWPVPADPR